MIKCRWRGPSFNVTIGPDECVCVQIMNVIVRRVPVVEWSATKNVNFVVDRLDSLLVRVTLHGSDEVLTTAECQDRGVGTFPDALGFNHSSLSKSRICTSLKLPLVRRDVALGANLSASKWPPKKNILRPGISSLLAPCLLCYYCFTYRQHLHCVRHAVTVLCPSEINSATCASACCTRRGLQNIDWSARDHHQISKCCHQPPWTKIVFVHTVYLRVVLACSTPFYLSIALVNGQ